MTRRLRQDKNIYLRKRGLILCEGKTEQSYFNGIKHDEIIRRHLAAVDITIYQPSNYSPLGLVKEAKERIKQAKRERNPYEFVWVVFDRNGHQNIPQAFNMASSNNINIAFSVICFEYWLLLHFTRSLKSYTKCDELISNLKSHYPDYEKIYDHYVSLKDKTSTALENGAWAIEQNQNDINRGTKLYELSAYTDVHLLVSQLLSLR
jgi:hypothetical protein